MFRNYFKVAIRNMVKRKAYTIINILSLAIGMAVCLLIVLFSYRFSNEEYQKLYMSEQVIGRLSKYFAFLAIFISCLGLLGLAMFTAEQRTKEFGIRKVLGAGAGTLYVLLSQDFLNLVFIAFILAFPLAWWVAHSWLQNFAYRINFDWWMFVIAVGIAISIALLMVSFQSIKAAIANPVNSLRNE